MLKDESSLSSFQLKGLESIKKIHHHPCYCMQYSGDYHFEDYMRQGAKTIEGLLEFMEKSFLFPPELMHLNIFGCTCFKIHNEQEEVLYGRNFDWHKKTPALLLTTKPQNCYRSISMVDLGVLGYKPGEVADSLWDRRHFLCAPYLPTDGMNEKGLAVAILTLPRFEPKTEESRPSLLCNTVLRLILDYASSVSEIEKLLDYFSISTFFVPQRKMNLAFHLFVADASGDSAVVEFEEGSVKLVRSKEPWQLVTNFNMIKFNEMGRVEGTGFSRYKKAHQFLSRVSGKLSNNDAMMLLKKCRNVTGSILFNAFGSAQTRWSILYNLSQKKAELVLEKDYENSKVIDVAKI